MKKIQFILKNDLTRETETERESINENMSYVSELSGSDLLDVPDFPDLNEVPSCEYLDAARQFVSEWLAKTLDSKSLLENIAKVDYLKTCSTIQNWIFHQPIYEKGCKNVDISKYQYIELKEYINLVLLDSFRYIYNRAEAWKDSDNMLDVVKNMTTDILKTSMILAYRKWEKNMMLIANVARLSDMPPKLSIDECESLEELALFFKVSVSVSFMTLNIGENWNC